MKIVFYNESTEKFYSIHTADHNNKWFLNNEEGEGMGMSENMIFEMIDKYFKENL